MKTAGAGSSWVCWPTFRFPGTRRLPSCSPRSPAICCCCFACDCLAVAPQSRRRARLARYRWRAGWVCSISACLPGWCSSCSSMPTPWSTHRTPSAHRAVLLADRAVDAGGGGSGRLCLAAPCVDAWPGAFTIRCWRALRSCSCGSCGSSTCCRCEQLGPGTPGTGCLLWPFRKFMWLTR